MPIISSASWTIQNYVGVLTQMKEGVETRADRANMYLETVSTMMGHSYYLLQNRSEWLSYRIVFIVAIQELNSNTGDKRGR